MDGVGEDVDLVAASARAQAEQARKASLLRGLALGRDRRHSNAVALAEDVDALAGWAHALGVVVSPAERVDREDGDRS